MLDFEKPLQSIGAQSILCVGDLMLDDFVYGEVARISPEAPAPVIAVKRNEVAIGGAGNVARNVASLGARCIFVGLVGADEAGRDVIARLQADPLIEPKAVDDAVYRGATVIKPNRRELAETARLPVTTDDEIIVAAAKLNEQCGTQAVLVSLSDEGLVLVPAKGMPIRVPAYPVKVKDASGAGDTVVAALAVMLAARADYDVAVRVANAAGAIVV